MGIREKILILLMACVIGYGVYDFTMTRIRAGSLKSRVEEVKKETEQLISTTRTNLEVSALSPRERELLTRIQENWTDDLFVARLHPPAAKPLPELEDSGKPGAPVEVAPTYRYTGYFNITGNKLAVINGAEYEVGQSIGTSTYRVHTIEPERVVLERESGSQTLTLIIHQPDLLNFSGK